MSAAVLTWVKPATDSLSEGSGREVTRPGRLVSERTAFSARTGAGTLLKRTMVSRGVQEAEPKARLFFAVLTIYNDFCAPEGP